jgi:hypothetical protein
VGRGAVYKPVWDAVWNARRQNVGIPGSSIVYHYSLAKYGYEMEDV